jgi:hypothetical protein
MAHVIIGIHGLNNKAEYAVLKIWWELALREGFKAAGHANIPFEFELIYWADLLYPHALNAQITDPEHPRYLEQPYKKVGVLQAQAGDKRLQKILDQFEHVTDKLLRKESMFKRFEGISVKLIEKRFNDLSKYLNGETGFGDAADQPIREVIKERFMQVLGRYKNSKICMIAHSMGSIIAYDIISHQTDIPEIDLMITVGSPLAQPMLMAKLTDVNPVFSKIKTPPPINEWYNLSDLHDLVAMNYNLSDDYEPNAKGVNPIDQVVQNGYTWEGESNAHHIVGYLQTPECANLVYRFLMADRSAASLFWARQSWRLQDRLFLKTQRMLRAAPSRPEPPDGKHIKSGSKEEELKRQAEN